VFPGVKIFIKNESLVVRSEFRGVTFCLEGKEVRVTKYEPSTRLWRGSCFMPLLPIDLQTMFSQMTQVGKEQAALKDTRPRSTSSPGTQIVKKTEQADNTVNQSRELGEGPDKVKEGEQGRRAAGPAGRQAADDGQHPEASGGRCSRIRTSGTTSTWSAERRGGNRAMSVLLIVALIVAGFVAVYFLLKARVSRVLDPATVLRRSAARSTG